MEEGGIVKGDALIGSWCKGDGRGRGEVGGICSGEWLGWELIWIGVGGRLCHNDTNKNIKFY